MVIKENGSVLSEGNKSQYFIARILGGGSFLYGEDIFLIGLLIKFNAILLTSLYEDK